MRTLFHQFFRPTKQDLDQLLREALICYDANVLLNIYRFSDETQKGLEDVFREFVDRTHLPHQVALEYSRNRAKTIVDQVNLCQAAENDLKKVLTKYIEPKNAQPFLSEASEKSLSDVMQELAAKRKSLEAMISDDKYAELYVSLFDAKISDGPDKEMLGQMHEHAADRYSKKIPPGYEDLKGKNDLQAFGDYVFWRQLMDIAKKEKKDFILVSDDSKEDWIQEFSGKTIGPRPELLEEFRRETGQRIWILNTENFLRAAKAVGSTSVSDDVISEVGAHLFANAVSHTSGFKRSSPSTKGDEKQSDSSLEELVNAITQAFQINVATGKARDPNETKAKVTETSAAMVNEKNSVPSEESGGSQNVGEANHESDHD